MQSHLGAIGLLRVLGKHRPDWGVRMRLDAHVVELAASVDTTDLAVWLLNDYEPTPAVSPWNAGSGLGIGYSPEGTIKVGKTSVPILDRLPGRLHAWRDTIAVARTLVGRARIKNWMKSQLVVAARNAYPDEAVPWIDACWDLSDYYATDTVRSNPALGTGGNIERADLGALMAARTLEITSDDRSQAWLIEALLGGHGTPLVESTEAHLGASGLLNPWRWLLAMEGLIAVCASSLTRQAGDFVRAHPAVISKPTAAGNVVAGEATHELWLPLWDGWHTWDTIRSALMHPAYLGHHNEHHWVSADTGTRAGSATIPEPLSGVARYHCVTRNGRMPFYITSDVIRSRPLAPTC
jgi:CRISPR-associated protein Csx17